MSDTITIEIPADAIPDGWEFVRYGRVENGECYIRWPGCPAVWSCPKPTSYSYIIVRRKAITGRAWLKAQGVGTVFDYEGERWAIEADIRGEPKVFYLCCLNTGERWCDMGCERDYSNSPISGMSDATCTVLCPAKGAKS